MTAEMLPYLCLGFGSVLVSAISQVMLKTSAMRTHKSKFGEYSDPLVIFAYGLFGASTLLTMFAYKKVPLSISPIFDCCAYILIILSGVFIFKEKWNKRKLLAVVILFFGIAVYSL